MYKLRASELVALRETEAEHRRELLRISEEMFESQVEQDLEKSEERFLCNLVIYVYVCICLYIYIYIHTHIKISTYTYKNIYTYIYIHVCVCVYVCV